MSRAASSTTCVHAERCADQHFGSSENLQLRCSKAQHLPWGSILQRGTQAYLKRSTCITLRCFGMEVWGRPVSVYSLRYQHAECTIPTSATLDKRTGSKRYLQVSILELTLPCILDQICVSLVLPQAWLFFNNIPDPFGNALEANGAE